METALQYEKAAFESWREASSTACLPAKAHATCAGFGIIVVGSETSGWSREWLSLKQEGRVNASHRAKQRPATLEGMKEREIYATNESQFFEKLITVEDLADAFGFAPQTVRNWVALRQIPFVRIGGKTRFRHKSIEAWIALKENKPCP